MSASQPDWGIRFPRPAAESGGLPLVAAPLAAQLTLPLLQNIGVPPTVMVRPGDKVLKGQLLAVAANNEVSACLHAPSSGTVSAITELPVTAGKPDLCVVIDTDGLDAGAAPYPARDPTNLSPAELTGALSAAGIVGLGGALFPTDVKLANPTSIDTLILNGVECEPHISCDDALMQNAATGIVDGAHIMMRITGAQRCLIAIKENSAALATMSAAVQNEQAIEVRAVPSLYPAGDESQLFRLLTGQELPTGSLPPDIGLLCQNVATAAAVARFFIAGEPLIERIVTVGGEGVQQPVNVRARIGTPIHELIKCAGGYTGKARRLIMGGPMMGIALPDDALPVTKSCNSLYVAGGEELAASRPTMPCIRCGECATACPVQLSPQVLLQAERSNDFEQLVQLGISECMECGACDYVCPSAIPLTQTFREGKQTLARLEFEQQRGALAEQRYAARMLRKQQDADALEETLEEQTAALSNATSALEELLKRTAENSATEANKGGKE